MDKAKQIKHGLLAGGATYAAFSFTGANAAIISGNGVFSSLSTSNDEWDIDGDGGADFALRASYSLFTDNFTYAAVIQPVERYAGLVVSNSSPFALIQLASGSTVNTARNFVTNGFTVTSSGSFANVTAAWQGDTPGFFGFQFNDNDGNLRYGYGTMTVDLGNSINITDVYYEDSGNSIQVGQTSSAAVPEPSNIAGIVLFVAGAAGVKRWRKRKEKAIKELQEFK